MDAGDDFMRRSLVDATRASLMRIALAFGLLNAVVPLFNVLLTSRTATDLLLAIVWVAAWMLAVFNAGVVGDILERATTRVAFVAAGSILTGATILATGGIDSPLANGAGWLGWAATVATQSRLRASFGVAALLAVGPFAAFAIDLGHSLFDAPHRYAVVTGPLNPFVIVLVALSLAGVFQGVVRRMPTTLWELRHGAAATTTPALRALLRGEEVRGPRHLHAAFETPLGAPQTSGASPAAQPLTLEERRIVNELADGLAPKEIARLHGTTVATIYATIAVAKRKVGAQTLEHLVALAWRPST